jgi:hypothetical protein
MKWRTDRPKGRKINMAIDVNNLVEKLWSTFFKNICYQLNIKLSSYH